MQITTATGVCHEPGPLTRVAEAFCARQGELIAAGITGPMDWEPLIEFIEAERFKRVGAYLEVLDWPEYRRFLTDWVAGGTRFEMTMFHLTEAGNAVFQEIEERHHRGDSFIRKNVIAVYRFSERGRIVHLDIYEQARDSGDWIKDAARDAMAG